MSGQWDHVASLVRPLVMALTTAGTGVSWPERVFLAWMFPRGIVAASVASLFALRVDDAGIRGGDVLSASCILRPP